MAQRSLPKSVVLHRFLPTLTVLVLGAMHLLTRTKNDTNILLFLIDLRGFFFVCSLFLSVFKIGTHSVAPTDRP